MDPNDPNVIDEKLRETNLGMSKCLCSNCNPSGAVYLINHFKYLTQENFDQYVLDPDPKDSTLTFPVRVRSSRSIGKDLPLTCLQADPLRLNPAMIDLTQGLIQAFKAHYEGLYGDQAPMPSDSLFTAQNAWSIAENLDQLNAGMQMSFILGSQPVSGSHENLSNFLNEWKAGAIGNKHLNDLESAQIERNQIELNMMLEKDLIAQKKKDKDIKRNRDIQEKDERRQAREDKQRKTAFDK